MNKCREVDEHEHEQWSEKVRRKGESPALSALARKNKLQICEINVGSFHRCKVCNFYYKKCSKRDKRVIGENG